METRELNSISDDLIKYDYLAKIDDFIQVTEWANGEGYDISINDRIFNLTSGQLDAINYLVQTLRYGGK
jgi:hypothetical protein